VFPRLPCSPSILQEVSIDETEVPICLQNKTLERMDRRSRDAWKNRKEEATQLRDVRERKETRSLKASEAAPSKRKAHERTEKAAPILLVSSDMPRLC